jgi:hypothetical protein
LYSSTRRISYRDSPFKDKDLPEIETQNPEEFHCLVAGLVNESKASPGIIGNSFEELEQDALAISCLDFPTPHLHKGPFQKYLPASKN